MSTDSRIHFILTWLMAVLVLPVALRREPDVEDYLLFVVASMILYSFAGTVVKVWGQTK